MEVELLGFGHHRQWDFHNCFDPECQRRLLSHWYHRNAQWQIDHRPASPSTSIPGNEPYTVDNLVFLGPGPRLTTHGFGFSMSDGSYSNPFYASFLPTPEYLELFSMPAIGHTELAVAFSAMPVSTPEAAAFAVPFGAIILLSGLAYRQRMRR
jgi:hypothetical protein